MLKRRVNYGIAQNMVKERSKTPANRSRTTAISLIQKSNFQNAHLETDISDNGTIYNSFRPKRNTVLTVKNQGQKSTG